MKKGINKDKIFLCNINALGTIYPIYIEDLSNQDDVHVRGYCSFSTKDIVIDSNLVIETFKQVTRHEIVHAFFNESGNICYTNTYNSERFVDWISIQGPKMISVMNTLGILNDQYKDINDTKICLRKINILGTDYKIYHRSEKEQPFKEKSSIYNTSLKLIVLNKNYQQNMEKNENEFTAKHMYCKRNLELRSIIIESFIIESGFNSGCEFNDREAIYWLAFLIPKMAKEFKVIDILVK